MQMRYLSPLPIVRLTLGVFVWCVTAVDAAADPFAECEALFATDPEARASAKCFFDQARQGASMTEAARKLVELRRDHDENPWLSLYLGHMLLISEGSQEAERIERLYRHAIRTFDEREEAASGVGARLDLSRLLGMVDRLPEAGEVLVRAAGIAETAGDRALRAEVRIRQAFQFYYQGERLDYAYHILHRVEQDVFPQAEFGVRKSFLVALALISRSLGRNDESHKCQKRLLALAQEAGDLTTEAEARFNLAVHHLDFVLPSPSARREARDLFEATLAASEAAAHPWIALRSHLPLGKLLDGEAGRRHLEACLEIAEDLASPDRLKDCRGAMAAHVAHEDPARARRWIDQALATAIDSTNPWSMIYGWEDRLLVDWATRPRPEAVARSLDLLDRIEELRELQGSDSGSAGLISLWSSPYYWLAGRLLENPGAVPDHADLELAFQVMERMRARVLLEALESARAAPVRPEAEPLIRQLAEILEGKAQVQRRLLDPRLDQQARDEAVAALRPLESRSGELRHLIAQASPSYAALHKPALATLPQIEESLDGDEALLSFQISADEDYFGAFAGGSWLLVSTRGGTRTYRLPGLVSLDPALDVLLGMEELEQAGAGLVRLYRDLLGRALEELPAGIRRLVIVPDGKLYRLPFSILRPAKDAALLIERYQLSVIPSATLWRRWRQLEPPGSRLGALALADPVLAGQPAASGEASRRQWAFDEGARLERLPYAREEGKAVVRSLGGASQLLLGKEANERFLKQEDLRRYAVLHFATHAVINNEVPERSAVMLAPGADDEDGWLQPQEIVELDLEGRIVVLASCNSGAGQVLRGEGPMSLARSFFHAGAPVVVASLWPLPDDETSRLFTEFYRHLARGKSVAQALALAQRALLRRGVPARNWAGLVALGNGDLVPFPQTGLPVWAYSALAILVLAVFWGWRQLRDRTERT